METYKTITVPSKTIHLSFLQNTQRNVRPLWVAFTQASAQAKGLVLHSSSQGIHALIWLDSKLWHPFMELDIQMKKVFPSKNIFKDEGLPKLFSKC